MKKIYLLPIAAVTLSAAAVVLPSHFFPQSSPLASGRWVKLRVDNPGVQYIPFDSLRAMGFDDPTAVAIFGRGNLPVDENFVDQKGTPLVEGEMTPAPSCIIGDSLFFYGVAGDYLNFIERPDSVGGSYFSRTLRHPNSRQGYYLLTDSQTPVRQDSIARAADPEALRKVFQAYDYIYYHRDSVQGFGAGGQVYFSDYINDRGWAITHSLTPEGAIVGEKAVVDASVITDTESGENSVNLILDSDFTSGEWMQRSASFMGNIFKQPLNTTLRRTNPSLTFRIVGPKSVNHCGLDYYAFTYRCRLPLRADREVVFAPAADTIAIPLLSTINRPVAWDVTNPLSPRILPVSTLSATNYVELPADTTVNRRLTTFDLDAPGSLPTCIGEVANTDLHSQAAMGADLIIITTPDMLAPANRLAQLHRDRDGITVIVADVNDIYNEYNSGTPSIMAYKSLIKHTYLNRRGRHLNVLLFGPMKSDLFSDAEMPDYNSFILTHQSPEMDNDLVGHNINDFLGMLDDYLTTRPEYSTIQAGVGLLPVFTPEEADRFVDKLEGYYDFPDHHLYLNNMLMAAGPGDKNTHLDQAKNLMNNYQTYYNQSLIQIQMVADLYIPPQLVNETVERFNRGTSLGVYMGHGTAYALNGTNPLFGKSDIHRLKNRELPFFLFGTCDLAQFDRHGRGLGESMMFDTPNGIIGGVMSSHMAYSTQNESMIRLFGQYLTLSKTTTIPLTAPKTVGQAWAEAKSQLRSSHENTFNMIADPAMHLAVPIYDIIIDGDAPMTIEPGGYVTYTGSIKTRKGNLDVENFNGKICAKVIGPASAVTVDNLTSKDQVSKPRTVTFADNVLSISEGEVKNSRFTLKVHAPVCPELREGLSVSLAFSAYDSDIHAGASGIQHVAVVHPGPDEQTLDTQAPQIADIRYDPTDEALKIVITDNVSVAYRTGSFIPGLEVNFDGTRVEDAATFDYLSEEPVILSLSIPVGHPATGEHFVEITARDYAGNSTEASHSFTVGSPMHFCHLIVPEYIDSTTAEFSLQNTDGPATTGRLVIADTSGETLLSIPFSGNEFTAEIADEEGNLLPTGLYRAYVVCDGPGFESSRAVTFAVINNAKRQ